MIQLRHIIRKKLSSSRGASITMALLLFLACAVIGAVVLNAGTASAGRLSDMAKTDRRYYSVASAAELLAKELNGQSIFIEETNTDGEETLVVDGVTITDSTNLSELPLLAAHAAHYAVHEHDMPEEMELVFPALAEEGYPETRIYISSVLDEKWRLLIELSDAPDDVNGFTLKLTMNPAVVLVEDWTETKDGKTTTKEITKISWSISDIE